MSFLFLKNYKNGIVEVKKIVEVRNCYGERDLLLARQFIHPESTVNKHLDAEKLMNFHRALPPYATFHTNRPPPPPPPIYSYDNMTMVGNSAQFYYTTHI